MAAALQTPAQPNPPLGADVQEVQDTPPHAPSSWVSQHPHPRLPSDFWVSCNVKRTPVLAQRSRIAQPGRCSAEDVSPLPGGFAEGTHYPCHHSERGPVGTHRSELRGDDVQQQAEHLQDKRLLPHAAAGAGRYPRHHGHDQVLHVAQLGQGLGGEGRDGSALAATTAVPAGDGAAVPSPVLASCWLLG